MVSSVKLDDCTFLSEDTSSANFKMEKPFFGITIENELFEANVYASIVSLLMNKLVRIDRLEKGDNAAVFQSHVENGRFSDIVNIESKFNKLLCIKPSCFHAFIKSAQAFSDSVAIAQYSYSASFALLVYAVESMANTAIVSTSSKREKMIRFFCGNVNRDQFLKNEIRQLEFSGRTGNERLLFQKLLHRSYRLRCNYVHEAEAIPILSQVADRLSMAFISNDQKKLFPGYVWLRRISYSALSNFLDNQPDVGRNRIRDYVEPLFTGKFKAKTAISKGQWITEEHVYLQKLSDDFLRKENLNA